MLRLLLGWVSKTINCPDVRSVIHLGPPEDLESYIQKTGRGGLPAQAVLLVNKKTFATCK